MLKAYYPTSTSFLDAQVGSAPSPTWRSVMEAKKVIEMGSLWRLEDGTLIKIWEDLQMASYSNNPRSHFTKDLFLEPAVEKRTSLKLSFCLLKLLPCIQNKPLSSTPCPDKSERQILS